MIILLVWSFRAIGCLFLFIILLTSFEQIYTNTNYQRAVKNAILERGNSGTLKLEDLSLEVGIKPSDVLKVLVDLRNKGLLRY
ncbi:MAG: hypothetical protein HeimC3_08960 [Candidatus Heimdallarchaeota archaeon LC_3]|nr:MAG: hypothetical protein HeimC3_08960 [Candidatus Heimdallarchaeota archaeon LC_3]